MHKAWLPLLSLSAGSIILMVIAIGISFNTNHNTHKREALVALVDLGEIAWRAAWYEPRIRRYQTSCYDPYPEMPPIDRLKSIYTLTPLWQKPKRGRR